MEFLTWMWQKIIELSAQLHSDSLISFMPHYSVGKTLSQIWPRAIRARNDLSWDRCFAMRGAILNHLYQNCAAFLLLAGVWPLMVSHQRRDCASQSFPSTEQLEQKRRCATTGASEADTTHDNHVTSLTGVHWDLLKALMLQRCCFYHWMRWEESLSVDLPRAGHDFTCSTGNSPPPPPRILPKVQIPGYKTSKFLKWEFSGIKEVFSVFLTSWTPYSLCLANRNFWNLDRIIH